MTSPFWRMSVSRYSSEEAVTKARDELRAAEVIVRLRLRELSEADLRLLRQWAHGEFYWDFGVLCRWLEDRPLRKERDGIEDR